jgi:hypothetical protein
MTSCREHFAGAQKPKAIEINGVRIGSGMLISSFSAQAGDVVAGFRLRLRLAVKRERSKTIELTSCSAGR